MTKIIDIEMTKGNIIVNLVSNAVTKTDILNKETITEYINYLHIKIDF